MNKLLIGIFVLLTACSNPGQFKVLSISASSNGIAIADWELCFPGIIKFIEDQNSDIVTLQAIKPQYVKDFRTVLGAYSVVTGENDEDDTEFTMNPVLFRSDRFTLLSKSKFWLSDTPEVPESFTWGGNEPRTVSWVKLQSIRSGHIFYVFNAHFCHLDESARVKSSILLLTKIHNIAGNAPVIVTGCFNMSETSASYQILTSNWDRYLSLENCSHTATRKIARKNANGLDEITPGIILSNGYLQTLKHVSYNTLSANGEKLTAHEPVMVKMRFLFERRTRQGTMVVPPWLTQ
ncbi:exonuclease/endonuclease/phosphatase family protein [Alkaliflexus imshenetskii]|uniref:hypothetical protein n=1 Tax=Alkaliflexus imshenetskii TaxID=286730 RepID=UPI00047B9253|nr:hypothetical protein [Alkaliflexus imshenetskii]